jgi:hypothetical protein
MPLYDREQFDPPAPVAKVIVRTLDRARAVLDVAMLIDSGSDMTLIPRVCADQLGLPSRIVEGIRLQGVWGSDQPAEVVEAEIVFLGRNFHGHFPLIDGQSGILGRNILNKLPLLLDGPRLNWREEHPAQ